MSLGVRLLCPAVSTGETVASPRAGVVWTSDAAELRLVESPDVQAVIYVPEVLPSWFAEVDNAVRSGQFHLERTTVEVASPPHAEANLAARLPAAGLPPAISSLVVEDIVGLVDRLASRTNSSRFLLRLLTERPSLHCGYHVDTVPPGVPRWGLLRVYNGRGTGYIESGNLVSTRELYRYMSRRERLRRDLATAAASGDGHAVDGITAELRELDAAAAFLRRPRQVTEAPAGSIVAFKHLDITLHWSDHDPSLAWVHCSPMEGDPRLVVNVSPCGPARRRGGARA